MTIERNNFPIVLTIIENFGLSSSWTGNAVASANPTNFYSMWKRNPHTVLYPDKKSHTLSYENSEIDLVRLFSGREKLCDKEYLDKAVESDQLKENSVLNRLLDDSNEHNSAFHLVGNIPGPNDKYADINHLLSLLEIIKNHNIFRVYLHLLVDENITGDPDFINDFLSKIKKVSNCEIASVIGQSYFDDSNHDARGFSRAVKTILSGDGDRALSSEQALSFKGLSRSSLKPPTSVVFDNRYVCKLGNFDTVLFFNHNNKSLTKLILALTTGIGFFSRTRLPKFLKIATMFNPLDQDFDRLQILFYRNSTKTLAQSFFSANIDQLYLSDSSRIATTNIDLKGEIEGSGGSIKELFAPIVQGANPEHYDQVLDLILEQLSISLEQKKAGFITFLIPVLSMPNINSFAKMVAVIKILDNFLPKLENEVFKHNGAMILTANHGGSEKMSDRDNFEIINSKTNNPVPFVLTIPGYKGYEKTNERVVANRMFYDMIKKSHFISDFAPTVLDLAHIPIPEKMTGKSFLSELKTEI